jgi:hypothetical protein
MRPLGRAATPRQPSPFEESPLTASDALPRPVGIGWPSRVGVFASAAAAVLVAGITFAVYWPILSHYFYGDDFVPLADIASRGSWEYARDLLLMRDLTPNWRVLPGLYYLANYEAFGLDAFQYLLGSLLVHMATTGLIFLFVRRATGATWPAFLAGAFFGVTAAHVPTVGQVTAFNNVLATFFVMAALVLLYESLEREGSLWWFVPSVLAYGGAIASNESTAALAPVFALVVVWRLTATSLAGTPDVKRAAGYSAPYIVLGFVALATFGLCGCTEAEETWAFGANVNGNLWIFSGRLLYPVGLEPAGDPGAAHLIAGLCVAALALIALIRGPALARTSVVFLLLALLPYLPLDSWTAPRYVYLAAAPFSMLAALYFWEIGRYAAHVSPVLPAALAVVAFGVLGLYGWQTWEQNQFIAHWSARWHDMVTQLQATYPALPPDSTVYARGAPITDPLTQCAVNPAAGEVLWGNAKLFTSLSGDLSPLRIKPGYHVYVADYQDGRFVPVDVPEATPAELNDAAVSLLPHVDPAASGNLCKQAVEADGG